MAQNDLGIVLRKRTPELSSENTAFKQGSIIRIKHYGWWIVSAVCMLGSLLLLQSLATNKLISWQDVRDYLFSAIILGAVLKTIGLTAAALLIGFLLGVILAIFRVSKHPIPRAMAWVYIWLFRGTPGLVQLVFWFNLGLLFPHIEIVIPFTEWVVFATPTNQLMSALVCALLGLGLNEAAYMAEIIRGGILGVDQGQRDAAKALGMDPWQTFSRIVFPQAAKLIIPPAGNELNAMLKGTSLVSIIGFSELLSTARRIYAINFKTIELLIVISFWYLVLTTIFTIVQSILEQRFRQKAQTISPTMPLRR